MINNSAVCLLEKAAQKVPEKTAVQDENGSRTYAELREESRRIASGILQNAVSSYPVMVYLPKSALMEECMFASLYSGRAYVPTDSAAPKARLERIIKNLTPSLIITNEALAENIDPEWGVKTVCADDLLKTEADDKAVDKALSSVIDEDPAYIMYTSGSTGEPKGVTIPHRGVINFAEWAKDTFGWNEDSVLANQAPLYFDVSVMDVYGALAAACKLILTPEVLFRFPSKLPEFLRDNGVTSVYWVPTVMIRVANSGALEEVELPRLRSIAFAGEVMPNLQLNVWRKALPGRIFANLYGPTETDVCTAYIADREFTDTEPLPIGNAINNLRVVLLSEEGKIGEEGEICCAGSGITLGYWNDPERTQKAFIKLTVCGRKELFYRTGDIGKYNEYGEIMFLGRRDGQIKKGGNRIELGEVESAARMVEGVSNVCALYDASAEEIVLFAECAEEIPLRKIQRIMRKFVPAYMIPAKTVCMKALPYNQNKKIDRALLKKKLEEKEF